MEILTGLFIVGLYKATEKIWEKGFDAAWEPVGEALKERFTRWAGRDQESQRRTAFLEAATRARRLTVEQARDRETTQAILQALDAERNKEAAEALAEEGAKLMLFSAHPDVPRLTRLCTEKLRWESFWEKARPPQPEAVAAVLSDFLANLREALLDQEPYHDLVGRETLRALRQIVAELRPVAYDSEATYRAQVAEMYRQLEFVGIPELKERRPITVEDIFIRLRTEREVETGGLPHYALQQELDVVGTAGSPIEWLLGLEALGEAGTGPRQIIKEQVSIAEALPDSKRMVILGDPGAGKTTLLKYLAVICAEGRAQKELRLTVDKDGGSPLPIFVPLREFAAECAQRGEDYCLLDHLYTCAREHLLLNLPPGLFEEALDDGRGLVCLDGLDEVWAVGQRKSVRDAVKALAARYPRSRYLVTSRIVGYGEAPLDRRSFVHHTILPFEDEDIRLFVRKWYEARERDPVQRKQKVDDLIATIEREPRIRSLAQNPLLLTIIALVHRIEAELPHERVKLYDKCVTALVETWEEVKGLSLEEKQRPFYRYRRRLLEQLAYELHAGAEEPGQLRTVKEGDLELLLSRFLMENRRLGFADDPDGARDEARAFIHLARGRTGLLVERGEGVFGFPHLTFQEYLAACDVENRCIHRGVEAIWEEIEPRLHDPHWREVILLLLGSLNKYDEPPTLLVERILEAGQDDKFEPVLHRHLYLAARALADRVDVAMDLHWRIVDTLVATLHSASPLERFEASSVLGNLEADAYLIRHMLDLIAEPEADVFVRRDASDILGLIAQSNGQVLNTLSTLAHEREADVWLRCDIAVALGLLGQVEEAVDLLLALAYDSERESGLTGYIARSLRRLGRPEPAVELLQALVYDSRVEASVRRVAAHDLAYFAATLGLLSRVDESIGVLLALSSNHQIPPTIRCSAAWSLAQLGHTEDAKVFLSDLAADSESGDSVRCRAAEILSEAGYMQEATPILQELAADPKVPDWVRCDAVSTLVELGQLERAISCIRDLVSNQRKDLLKERPIQIAGEISEEAVIFLRDVAANENLTEHLRHAALKTLIALGCDEKTTDVLVAVAQDLEVAFWVRNTAYEGLKALVG